MAVVNGTAIDETLNGTTDSDEITGGAGNDELFGGAGRDAAIYAGNSTDYRFGWNDGRLTVTDLNTLDGDDGTDSLREIEQLRFADRTYEVTQGGLSRANSTTDRIQESPSTTALADGGWLVTWEGQGQDDDSGIFFQRYDSAGTPIGGETLVNSSIAGSQAYPSVAALADGGWIISWAGVGADDAYDVFTQRYSADGTTPIPETQVVKTGSQSTPAITGLSDGGWVLSWTDNRQVLFQRYDSSGNAIGNEVTVSQSSTAFSASVTAIEDGGWVVSWYEIDTQKNYIGYTRAQRFTEDGEPAGTLQSFGNFAQETSPSVTTLSDGGWLMAWRGWDGIYTQRYDANNNPIGTPNSISASGGDVDVIGLADGGWLITLSTYDTWSEYDYAETISTRFNASGQQIAVISSGERGDMQTTPAVTTPLPDGGWLVTWEAMDDDYTGIFSQRYNAQGVAQLLEVNGTDQDDVLRGQSPLALSGGAGNDIYVVETAAAIVREHVGEGVDAVYSYLSSYTLEKNVENGRILATGPGSITGNELNNVLYAGTGESGYGYVLNGGAGIDTASFAYSKIGVTAQINFPGNMINPAYNSLNDMENLIGSDHNDFLGGDLGNNVINGGLGADKMTGGDGSDTYYVDNAGDEVIETGLGTDIVYSYLANYTLGNNVENGLILSTGIANITGNSLNNVIYAGAGNNLLNGAGGVDTVSYAYAASAISANLAITTAQTTGGSGLDTLIAIENLIGSAYSDSLIGNSANNKLSGGAGNDVLNGGAGADNLVGGDGSDTYFVDNAGDVISETNADLSSGGNDLVNSYISKYILSANIENGRVTATGTASLTGNTLHNILYAGVGNNVLDGSGGSDTASYQYSSAAVTVSLAIAAAQATGSSGSDTLISIENLSGSNYNDTLTGNAANNSLSGGLGNDTLNGGAGVDKMLGGDGSDNYYVDHTSDVVSETNTNASTGGTDTVFSYLSNYNLGANIENGRILATGAANLLGNSLNNVLTAGNGNNVLNGGEGIDTASYAFATSAVAANLSSSSAQATGGSGPDTLISIENLIGSNYNDALIGSSAGNILNGGSGNDRLTGGSGQDILVGGAGNDTFAFNSLSDSGSTSASWDVINDFIRGSDKIDLSKLDANTAASGDNAFTQVIASTAAFTAAGQLKISNGVLYGNIDADADAEFAIQLVGVTSVSLADFIA